MHRPNLTLAFVLCALAAPLSAEILARFQTTLGQVEVVLEYQQTPQTVANFITLAQGTRSRIDPASGAVLRSPLYIGEKFFRVIDNPGFKIAQTGSGSGTNAGGPGFTFKDEFRPALFHEPYVLSMVNSGPNTNGSQIFLTGSSAIPSLDGLHTVFGKIINPASRAVLDAILAAGRNGSSITGLTFHRTDAPALAFDEHAQSLPTVTRSSGSLAVQRMQSTLWTLQETTVSGSIFAAFRSTTLTAGSWAELPAARRHLGFLSAPLPAGAGITLDSAAAPAAFYHLSLTHHPGSVTPSSLANLRVNLTLRTNVLSYLFDATGTAGTAVFTPSNGGEPESFPFAAIDPGSFELLEPSTGGHHFAFYAYAPYLKPQLLWIKAGCATSSADRIYGRFAAEALGQSGRFTPFASGPISVTPHY